MIKHIAAPAWPKLRFEYHPDTRKLFAIHTAAPVGMLVAENLELLQVKDLLQIWLRGYKEGGVHARLEMGRS